VSDDLVVSGGGSTAVATEALLSQRQHLEAMARDLSSCLGRLVSIDRIVTVSGILAADAPVSALEAERRIDEAYSAVHDAGLRALVLSSMLGVAAESYGAAERLVESGMRSVAAQFAYGAGPALLVGLPVLVGGLGIWGSLPEEVRKRKTRELERWLGDHRAALSDPRVVEIVRRVVSDADQFGFGLAGLPEPLARLLGEQGLDVVGVAGSAATVVALARGAGVLRETAVSVHETARAPAEPSRSWQDRAGKVPEGAAQIRIDRYSEQGRPDRFEVSLGGTIDTSVVSTTEPWDMTSNLSAIAHQDAGSYLATRQAMAAAGIDSSSPVVFTGYSQGGLLAAMLASSGDYDTKGLFTLGAPAGQIEVSHDIPYLAIEHREDLVPATGGDWKSSDPVLVRRDLFDGPPDTREVTFPAHELSRYRQTAAMLDGSDESRIAGVGDALDRFGDGATSVQTTMYRAERLAGEGGR
jgi:hypothetical protein